MSSRLQRNAILFVAVLSIFSVSVLSSQERDPERPPGAKDEPQPPVYITGEMVAENVPALGGLPLDQAIFALLIAREERVPTKWRTSRMAHRSLQAARIFRDVQKKILPLMQTAEAHETYKEMIDSIVRDDYDLIKAQRELDKARKSKPEDE